MLTNQVEVCGKPGVLILIDNTEELQAFRRLVMDRATNCLEPALWPAWLRKLDAAVDGALGLRIEVASRANS